MGVYSNKSLKNCLPIWEFCYKISRLYVWNIVFGNSVDSFDSHSKKPIQQEDTAPTEDLDPKYLLDEGDHHYDSEVEAMSN